jgi:tetratricopeptide (TPR) repeat protein
MTDKFSDLLEEGYRAQRENRLADSRAIFLDCVRKASLDSDRSSLAEAFIGLAEAENSIGNCPAALHHYANAALLYREILQPKKLASALEHQATLLVQSKQPQEAKPLYLEAQEIYTQHGDAAAAAETETKLSQLRTNPA